MSSSLAALIGLVLAIILILKKVSPVYSLMLGAIAGGLMAGTGLAGTITNMIDGVKGITPAILRILAAGVLSGVLIKTGAAETISRMIVKKLGSKRVYLALALATMILCAVGVFIDVAVITVAPIALMIVRDTKVPIAKVLLAMIGGGKCGNIISPNPNTIVAAENYNADLSIVMASGIIPAILGLLITVYVIIPLFPDHLGKSHSSKLSSATPSSDNLASENAILDNSIDDDVHVEGLPSFGASIIGPLVTILLLAMRPLFNIAIDPLVALPVGGLVGILATRSWSKAGESIGFGLEKMSTVAILLVGTGTIAGVINASDMKDVVVGFLERWNIGGTFMAPISSALMSAATASSTAGSTIASASFASTVLAAGIPAAWAAAMTNAGATVLDHLPHGSFFHATGGSVGMSIKDRLRLIPYESLVGLILTILSVVTYLILG